MTTELGFAPNEDPFVVVHGGFYRRWFSMIDDIGELETTVSRLEGTTEDLWVPVWEEVGRRHEDEGDRLEETGDHDGARRSYLQAKTFYAIGRFPGEVSDEKRRISEACNRAYRKACQHLDPPMEVVEITHQGETVRAHFRAPVSDTPVAAVLIMCGADVFKEDRGWAQDLSLENGMASLVMDGPASGENPFPWAPESVSAWEAAVDYLAARPEVDAGRIGAFGISRGGYSVMQLAGTSPEKLGAVVANAGHPFGYVLGDEEMEEFVRVHNERATLKFGPPDGPASFEGTSVEKERADFSHWALSEQGIIENITMPVFMINGKHDHLAPIGNIYYMLETGPATGKEARVYADAGHCAFKYYDHWAPATFQWLAEKLG
ncbi:MAG: alpha/beta hydrolase [Acidimicrobiia bacterium]|nr:alpha/beta hydrolase [Acidimicrobiia bacterium]